MTGLEAAEKLGLRSYDFALPQEWWDAFYRKTGQSPSGLFVWCYDKLTVFGGPVALTLEARNLAIAHNIEVQ